MTIGLLALSAFLFLNNQDQGPQDKLIGVWIPDIDGYEYRWAFKEDGIMEQYSEGNMYQKSNYTIQTNPQCEVPVNVEDGWYYVVVEPIDFLERIDGGKWVFCYEIDVLSEKRLSLLFIGGASLSPITFERFVPQQGD